MPYRSSGSILVGFLVLAILIICMSTGVFVVIDGLHPMSYQEQIPIVVGTLMLIGGIFALITHTENVGRANRQYEFELRRTAEAERDVFETRVATNKALIDGRDTTIDHLREEISRLNEEIDRLSKCGENDRETIKARIDDIRKAETEVRTKALIMNAVVASLVVECVRLHEIKANAVTNHTLKEMRFKLAEIVFSLVSAGGARLDQAEARSLGVLRDWLDEEVKARPGNFNESNPRVGYFVHAVCVTSLAASREKADAAKAAVGAQAANGGKNASP